ncbi:MULTISPECIES: 2-amino-4-hydroxy-6-hydroxymethyldihydropteridine diphosphokinase [Pseudovibrio]|uniref:2-amino-4-hydroxy-6- hydroxymethyldihydropteridine diphosphokinase n=1 Tax=Stappiaceae TaxID=2821832 RepID=UPI002367099F|nr:MULTISPECIES: 2-amino-4-hydroxy-6-hydroxymethyldihydropteridine diphosphokinase [Pseudovibrio]MDD7909393.1 2-amino-4-hydroxy-6-hydroxymethyldihydropteridine diphosphokinase [Pseudovibrio exalbescens]MDX5594952.1 2-amino-4-hydroxy-6-hydroxymethyldihydropteridine diphosphokinase [Pseudovibrio sp. SPO723]
MQSNVVMAALGLGSNMGDTKSYIEAAISALSAFEGIEVVGRSSDYRTPPWGPVPQDDYRNCCVTVKTHLSPKRLLEACLGIEKQLGRVRDERWGPRTIDIDVLLYGETRVEDDVLSVPHPRMMERAFVLVPLAEIWPNALIGGGLTVAGALEKCPDKNGISKL